MSMMAYHCWGLRYLVVGRWRWEREHATDERLRGYEVLDLWEATRALQEMARDDMRFVRRVAGDVLGYRGDLYSGGIAWADADARLLEELTGKLGSFTAPGQPPDFAGIYVCRRETIPPAHEPLPEPKSPTREAIEAAKRAPRGYVVVEAVTDSGAPVPSVRVEVLLSDGEVCAGTTDAGGRLHLAPVPQGQCHIRVLDVDGSAWRPEAGGAATCVERRSKRSHIVKSRQNLTRIARQHGIGSWKPLWDMPDNEGLRERRKNPNLLRPGDAVVVPGIAIHAISRPTDQTHRIVIGSARAVVALLNTHLLAATSDVNVYWSRGSSTLAAASALFRDETSLSLRLSDVAEHAGLALVAPPAGASDPASSASGRV